MSHILLQIVENQVLGVIVMACACLFVLICLASLNKLTTCARSSVAKAKVIDELRKSGVILEMTELNEVKIFQCWTFLGHF